MTRAGLESDAASPPAFTMPAHSPPSPSAKPPKRARQSSFDDASPTSGGADQSPSADLSDVIGDKSSKSAAQQSSTFRNVSACNRCRLRKNRCDQKLPSCASCAKAGVACVGYDPITKKEIPRRYAPMQRHSIPPRLAVLILPTVMSTILRCASTSSRHC